MKDLYNSNRGLYVNNPKELIKRAHEENKHQGSTTVVAVGLDDYNTIHCAFIGDSQFMILRP